MTTKKNDKHHERAERLRLIAEDVRGEDDRKFVLEIAKEYEQVANPVSRNRGAKRPSR